MRVSGSRQPQLPWDKDSPWDICASLVVCPVKPPAVKLPVKVFLEEKSFFWRSLIALLLIKLSLDIFQAFPWSSLSI